MLRTVLCTLALALVPYAVVHAADASKKSDHNNKSMHATITKIDAKNHTVSVKYLDNQGQEQDKTLQLSSDVKYENAAGKEAKADAFKAGDEVCITKNADKVTELKRESEGTITKVDKKAGTVTVKMLDDHGKSVEKTFHLVENSEYVDSTGRAAVLDVFQSGDDVLFVEANGHIQSMKKSSKKAHSNTSAKDSNDKTSSK
ncbi:MAG TPA: hypothetical protein VFE24_01180 [Pirellulales bacterium]|jgi:anti-sigma-K factor RskA|nr:hypothetical protein [Pirellulales bacterium]